METSNIEPELNSLLNKLVIEISGDRKEVEFRNKRIEKNEALLKAVRGSLGVNPTAAKSTGYGSKAETVRLAINNIPTPRFTQNEVESAIAILNPELPINRNRIRATLWTMASKGLTIKIHTKGNNNQPAVYEKIANPANGSKLPHRSTPPPRPQSLTQPSVL